jgi:hypothetical protein
VDQATYTDTDISEFSFEEFIDFLFDRDIPPPTEKWNPWYWHAEIMFDPQRVYSYYTQLFRQPRFLLARFSKTQLDEGFWGIQSDNLRCSVRLLIWNTDLPLSNREQCVRTMVNLFRDLFAIEPLDTAVQMWWDSLCYDWHCGNRSRLRGGEDLSMQNVMFESLVEILAMDSEHCQDAALHGLGHLHHPATEQIIQSYLAQHPSLDKNRRDYALAAARFKVL